MLGTDRERLLQGDEGRRPGAGARGATAGCSGPVDCDDMLLAKSRQWEAREEMLGAKAKAHRGRATVGGRAVVTGTATSFNSASQVEGRRPGEAQVLGQRREGPR